MYFKIQDDRNEIFYEKAASVYGRIDDQTSREIFSNCLLYSLTGDPTYVRRNIDLTDAGRRFGELLRETSSRHPVIYGAGVRGRRLADLYPEIEWAGYCDRKAETKQINGLDVIPYSEIGKISGKPVVVSNLMGYREISEQLVNVGIPKEKIICLEDWN